MEGGIQVSRRHVLIVLAAPCMHALPSCTHPRVLLWAFLLAHLAPVGVILRDRSSAWVCRTCILLLSRLLSGLLCTIPSLHGIHLWVAAVFGTPRLRLMPARVLRLVLPSCGLLLLPLPPLALMQVLLLLQMLLLHVLLIQVLLRHVMLLRHVLLLLQVLLDWIRIPTQVPALSNVRMLQPEWLPPGLLRLWRRLMPCRSAPATAVMGSCQMRRSCLGRRRWAAGVSVRASPLPLL